MNKAINILSTSSIIILIILAGGNLLFGMTAYYDDQNKMICLSNAIYNKTITYDETMKCLHDVGLFKSEPIMWMMIQFTLIFIVLTVGILLEATKQKKKSRQDR